MKVYLGRTSGRPGSSGLVPDGRPLSPTIAFAVRTSTDHSFQPKTYFRASRSCNRNEPCRGQSARRKYSSRPATAAMMLSSVGCQHKSFTGTSRTVTSRARGTGAPDQQLFAECDENRTFRK